MQFRHLEQALYNSPSDRNCLLHLLTPLREDILVAEYLYGWESMDRGGVCLGISALSIDTSLLLEGYWVRRYWSNCCAPSPANLEKVYSETEPT